MQTQTITVQLQLAGLVVLGVREDAWAIEVAARYEREEVAYPHCALPTRRYSSAAPLINRIHSQGVMPGTAVSDGCIEVRPLNITLNWFLT